MLNIQPTQSNAMFDKTYPTFGTYSLKSASKFPEEVKDIEIGGLKSKIDVEMSFMKVVFSTFFRDTLYGAGIKNCKLVRYQYVKQKLICSSRLCKWILREF